MTPTTHIQCIIDELKSIQGQKIVTWQSLGRVGAGNFDMQDEALTTTTWNRLATLWRPQEPMSLVVRQFTDCKDEKTHLRIKKIHSYFVSNEAIRKLSMEESKACHEYDASGKYIGKEDGVEYA